MDMPKTIKVGAHTYAVLRKTKSQMNTDLGGCDTNTLQISVQQRLKKSKAKEILVHEVLHACTHPSFLGAEDKFTDEDFVTAVAPVLLQVIQDNPDLLAYLTQ